MRAISARYAELIMEIRLDDWQKKFLATAGDKILCTGRQVGKSVICGRDCGEWAKRNPDKVVLMIAPTERQAYALFDKTFNWLMENCPAQIARGRDKPTKTKITLRNKTKIYCLPTGIAGLGIRFLTVNRLYADEASRIPEEVWTAVTPMLLTTGGASILLSTPAGPDGHFARIVKNEEKLFDSFTRFSCSSEQVVRTREICDTWTEHQRDKALEHLKRERARMSKLEYAQEYEGELVDELKQFFSSEIIKSCMTLEKNSASVISPLSLHGVRSLGSDIARMGGDEFTIIGLLYHKKRLRQFEQIVREQIKLTDCSREIMANDERYNYKKLYIDDGGLGAGVIDILLETKHRRKVVAINNAARAYEHETDDKRSKKLLKEQLYNNLLALMEKGMIDLYKDNDLFNSLRSCQSEYKNGRLRIFGKNTHLAEALVRAAWIVKEKGLNIWIA